MAGGWEQGARLPAIEALAWADTHYQERLWSAYQTNLLTWATYYAQREDPPPPPTAPED